MPVDLSYAKEMPPEGRVLRYLAMSVKGWTIGWAVFEGATPKAVGSFLVKSHHEGKAVPVHQKNLGALRAVIQIATKFQPQILVSHTKDASSPLWALPSSLAAFLGIAYGDLPSWQDQIGANLKTLRSWVTLVSGKAPSNDQEILAMGLGAAAAQAHVQANPEPKLQV
jgi:hypothetical protein